MSLNCHTHQKKKKDLTKGHRRVYAKQAVSGIAAEDRAEGLMKPQGNPVAGMKTGAKKIRRKCLTKPLSCGKIIRLS